MSSLVKKEDIANMVTETLFQEDLLNIADVCNVEVLEKSVKNVIMDYLRNYIIINGQIIE